MINWIPLPLRHSMTFVIEWEGVAKKLIGEQIDALYVNVEEGDRVRVSSRQFKVKHRGREIDLWNNDGIVKARPEALVAIVSFPHLGLPKVRIETNHLSVIKVAGRGQLPKPPPASYGKW